MHHYQYITLFLDTSSLAFGNYIVPYPWAEGWASTQKTGFPVSAPAPGCPCLVLSDWAAHWVIPAPRSSHFLNIYQHQQHYFLCSSWKQSSWFCLSHSHSTALCHSHLLAAHFISLEGTSDMLFSPVLIFPVFVLCPWNTSVFSSKESCSVFVLFSGLFYILYLLLYCI